MKVLFVSSGNSQTGINILAKKQGESLRENGFQVKYFAILGKGIMGYLKNILLFRRFLKRKTYDIGDIVYAHYSLYGVVALLAGVRPLVVS